MKTTLSSSRLTQRFTLGKNFFSQSNNNTNIDFQTLEIKVDSKYRFLGNTLIFNVWDFSGSQIFLDIHQLFLSENALYLIVWNCAESIEKEIVTINYWIHTIKNICSDPTILLIGTHSLSAVQLCLDVAANCKKLSQVTQIPLKNIVTMDCDSKSDFETLSKLITEYGLQLTSKINPFPSIYFHLKQKLDLVIQDKNRIPILTWSEFTKIGLQCQIVGELELQKAASIFHNLGFYVFFEGNPFMLILNPTWFCELLRSLYMNLETIEKEKKNFLKYIWKQYPAQMHEQLKEYLHKFQILVPSVNSESETDSCELIIPFSIPKELPKQFDNLWSDSESLFNRIYYFNPIFPPDLFRKFLFLMYETVPHESIFPWKSGFLIRCPNVRALVLFNFSNRTIFVSYSGKEWYGLFRRIYKCLAFLSKSFKLIKFKAFTYCPTCYFKNLVYKNALLAQQEHSPRRTSQTFALTSLESTNLEYCFEIENYKHLYSQKQFSIYCKKSQLEYNLIALMPEITRTEIPQILDSPMIIHSKTTEDPFFQFYRGKFQGKPVIIKSLKTETEKDESMLLKLSQEIELFSNFGHPNLVQIIALVPSKFYFIVPNYESTLQDILYFNKLNNLNWPLAVKIFYDVANGFKIFFTSFISKNKFF